MYNIKRVKKELLPLARSVSQQAYSPYSRIKVGAVVVGERGELYSGCNVENASYGLTQCAERNALAAAIVAGEKPGRMRTLLVYSNEFETLSPCGACRQVISELLAEDAKIISCSEQEKSKTWTVRQLLPDPFSLDQGSSTLVE